ncbi:MAG: aspartate aminotransferase family protein [Thaumarchaeota archaeon]|nr:aspartate aminotransferase family protein [Nitrososphaerota archaeon]
MKLKPNQESVFASDVSRYKERTKSSLKMYEHAKRLMPGGQSHNARFFEPYPFYAAKAKGKYIWDVDGNRYVDYWMGHTALILGHSPEVAVKAIGSQSSNGLLFGSANRYAVDLAELVNKVVPSAESVRFCTTGAEATMYAVRLARAFTNRRKIIKMAGGWHGYNSALSVGVSPPYDVPESAGLVGDDDKFVKLAKFNDIEVTKQVFEEDSGDIAGVIVEPIIGAGGVIPANKEYLEYLRTKCIEVGAILIFEEIITGFRVSLGGAQEYYGIKPDLCTLGKILGGGLPVSAVAGRADIMELADVANKSKTHRCWIGGGTFSENALCMRAGIATLSHLMRNRKTIYRKIDKLGETVRSKVDAIFSENGIRAKSTGRGSLFATHFLSENQESISSPADVNASNKAAAKHYYFSMIARNGIFYLPAHVGAISTAHERTDIDDFLSVTEAYAKRISRLE